MLERLQALFRETFDRTLEPITAGSLARSLTPGRPGASPVASWRASPSRVGSPVSRAAAPSVAWADDDPTSLDYLGNEFLVWIWHTLQNDGETVKLADGSEVTVMLAKTLTLDCPRGETGRDQLTDDAPTRLPEAFRALQAGKLPRKAGMILVRHGAQYELTLQAETLAVSGAALPKPEDDGLSRHEPADRPHRQPPAPDRDARPALRGLPAPPDRHRLDRRARPHPPMAPGGLTVARGIDRLPHDPFAALRRVKLPERAIGRRMATISPSVDEVCPPPDGSQALPAWRMAASLFGLSFAAALFTLSILKLLSFFVMPSLLFDLLLIGFPLGAWLGARFLAPDSHRFVASLWGLTAMMVLSILCCLLAKRFDYLRASLFHVELAGLVRQLGAFLIIFLPFFASYGLCEYLGYQVGRRRLGGRMSTVYAAALFGAAAAYLVLKALLPSLGMARMLILAFIALAIAILAVGGRTARWAAAIEAATLLSVSWWPGLESAFLDLYKGQGANRPGTSGSTGVARPSSRSGGAIASARS